jgi:hypothetical protein
MINSAVFLTFSSSEGKDFRINYSSGFRVTCLPSDLDRECREKLLRFTPSVLGMDVLAKFEVYISKKRIELTR